MGLKGLNKLRMRTDRKHMKLRVRPIQNLHTAAVINFGCCITIKIHFLEHVDKLFGSISLNIRSIHCQVEFSNVFKQLHYQDNSITQTTLHHVFSLNFWQKYCYNNKFVISLLLLTLFLYLHSGWENCTRYAAGTIM